MRSPIKTVVIALGVASLSACATNATRFVMIETTPVGATLTFADGSNCESPCRIGVNGALEMTVARLGYRARTISLTPDSPATVKVRLERIDDGGEFEEVALPDL